MPVKMERTRLFRTLPVSTKNAAVSLEIVWRFLLKLQSNPTTTRLGISLREGKVYVRTKACTQMFTAAFCVTGKTWTQPECSSTGE